MSEFAKYCKTPGGEAEYVLLHLFGTVERFEQFLEDNWYPPEEYLARASQRSIDRLFNNMLNEMIQEKQ